MGHGDEVDELLTRVPDSAEAELLRALAARRPRVEGQALHGDAHLGNVMRGLRRLGRYTGRS